MRAGELRHRVTFQQLAEISDGAGGYTETWSDITTVWASVSPLSGLELYRAQQVQAETTHKITIRYRSGLDSKMRAKFGSRYFGILAIINKDESNISLELYCKEVL